MPTTYNMGPRIDISESPETQTFNTFDPSIYPLSPHSRNNNYQFWIVLLIIISLVVALLSSGISIWALMAIPEKGPDPPPSTNIISDGTIERIGKLEKDSSQISLRLITLEKDLAAVNGKFGSLTKLVEINAKVVALQNRIENMSGEKNQLVSGIEDETALSRRAIAKPPVASTIPSSKLEVKSELRPELSPAVKAVAKSYSNNEIENSQTKKAKQIYIVHQGDTLFSVAMRFKTSTEDIMRWNEIKAGDLLKAGQQLVIYK